MSDILDDPNAESKPAIWQSLREFDGSLDRAAADSDSDKDVANFVGREFPTDDFDQLNEVDRRRFFQILGASAALAGASSCRWEKEEILPYAVRPEETIPGKPKYYASTLDLAGAARPVTVTSYDGRPVKVEPNTLLGQGTDVYSQAEVLGFYDPDRSQGVLKRDEGGLFNGASYGDALKAMKEAAAAGGMAVLASTHSSPTLARLGADLAASGADWVWWSPVGRDTERSGAEMAFGKPVRTHYDLSKANVVVSLDGDFLNGHPDSVRMSADFATRREPELGDMSRLYAIESRFSTTGVVSDHRLPVRSSDAGAILQLIEAGLGMGTPGARAAELGKNDKVAAFVKAVADDMKASGGNCVIIPGVNQPAEVHAHAHAVNAALGAVGTTVTYTDDPAAGATDAGLASLVAGMRSRRGEVAARPWRQPCLRRAR